MLQRLSDEKDESPDQRGGARWESNGLVAAPSRLERYLELTGGAKIAALGPDGFLPPTFTSVWETACVLDLLRVAGFEFPVKGLIHVASGRVQLRPILASEPVGIALEVADCDTVRAGARINIGVEVRNRAGRLCSTGEIRLLMRGVGAPRGLVRRMRRDDGDEAPETAAGEWRTVRGWSLPGSLGRRYAAVSGDFNPIHLFRPTARLFGFPRQILHGCCSEALIAHAIIQDVLGGDPIALRRLNTDLSGPLLLPAQVRLEISEYAGGGRFRLVGSGEPRPFVQGDWVGRPEGAQG